MKTFIVLLLLSALLIAFRSRQPTHYELAVLQVNLIDWNCPPMQE